MANFRVRVQPPAAAYCHICAWKVTATSNVSALDSVIEHVEFAHPLVIEILPGVVKP